MGAPAWWRGQVPCRGHPISFRRAHWVPGHGKCRGTFFLGTAILRRQNLPAPAVRAAGENEAQKGISPPAPGASQKVSGMQAEEGVRPFQGHPIKSLRISRWGLQGDGFCPWEWAFPTHPPQAYTLPKGAALPRSTGVCVPGMSHGRFPLPRERHRLAGWAICWDPAALAKAGACSTRCRYAAFAHPRPTQPTPWGTCPRHPPEGWCTWRLSPICHLRHPVPRSQRREVPPAASPNAAKTGTHRHPLALSAPPRIHIQRCRVPVRSHSRNAGKTGASSACRPHCPSLSCPHQGARGAVPQKHSHPTRPETPTACTPLMA